MKDDDNFFDDDDALDYCLYEEMTNGSKDNQDKSGNKGCLGMIILLILPAAFAGYYFINIL